MEFVVQDVNEALAKVLPWMLEHGVREPSRNGSVLAAPEPVMTTYLHPTRRVVLSATRNANPFFHFMEALWMLAGRNDVAFVAQFVKRMKEFSDDGVVFNGAYGYRWRRMFGVDQLAHIVLRLRENPADRRIVLSMWDGHHDFDVAPFSKDVPCNTHAYFDVRGGKLNMTVCNRSNDIIWGAYGANVVHFSILQEYLAAAIGVPVGVYRQFSNNFHIYTGTFSEEHLRTVAAESAIHTGWVEELGGPEPLFTVPENVTAEVGLFVAGGYTADYENNALRMAVQMYRAWGLYKEGHMDLAQAAAGEIEAVEWMVACQEWLQRRAKQ